MDTKRLGLIPSILLMSVFLLSCGDSIEKKLIGEWENSVVEGLDSFIFNKDGSWVLVFGNITKPEPKDGIITENMNWTVDETENLIHLDCIEYTKSKESGRKLRLVSPFIIRFLGENKIQVRFYHPEDMPKDNTTSPPTIYMGKRPTSFDLESDGWFITTYSRK